MVMLHMKLHYMLTNEYNMALITHGFNLGIRAEFSNLSTYST